MLISKSLFDIQDILCCTLAKSEYFNNNKDSKNFEAIHRIFWNIIQVLKSLGEGRNVHVKIT